MTDFEKRINEAERKLFEADAEQYGFDLTRRECAAPEPWSEYASDETGHRWGGWLAHRDNQKHQNELRREIERAKFLLQTAAKYILMHCPDNTIAYDGTECDGVCLSCDCEITAEQLTD